MLGNETNALHAQCINAISGHIFPKNAMQIQKLYLHKVCLCNSMTISKYFVHWCQQNDYLALFPPHDGAAQTISNDEIIELIYENILNHMKKHQEWKAKKATSCNEINEMVAESVKSVKEIFQTHMKTLKKCNCEDANSDSGSEHENYHMDDVSFNLKDINVSETFALSDLLRPTQKCQKTNHLTPVTIALVKTWLGKSRFKKIRILLDSRSSGYIILEKFVHKL